MARSAENPFGDTPTLADGYILARQTVCMTPEVRITYRVCRKLRGKGKIRAAVTKGE